MSQAQSKPFNLHGLKTYDLSSRPSKVFHDDLGQPVDADATAEDWLLSLPKQLAANDIRRVTNHLCRAHREHRTVAVALGGHVIKTGCGPYLIDWVERGLLKAVVMNGAAAIHDLELALAGKTSEDVAASLPLGQFGMARDTADAFALAARVGAEDEAGLGWAMNRALQVWGTGAGADRAQWVELQRNGMRLPLAWEHRIGEYVSLYRRLAPEAREG